ncbi:MAG: helix-turn-helix domain-containing protein [Oscillospiraceae bacterium]|nr:helix-turn-helix domain-containing protein [Oscillospiraceae bacterium]
MEKLYTVDDIAKMTSLTTRTIRNYIKDGLLKGRKIGGQWRFTEEDIKMLMDSGTVMKSHIDDVRQDVEDFLDNVYTEYSGNIQICTIVDLYDEQNILKEKYEKLQALWNTEVTKNSNNKNFSWENNEEKARVTLFATPEFLIEALKILQ